MGVVETKKCVPAVRSVDLSTICHNAHTEPRKYLGVDNRKPAPETFFSFWSYLNSLRLSISLRLYAECALNLPTCRLEQLARKHRGGAVIDAGRRGVVRAQHGGQVKRRVRMHAPCGFSCTTDQPPIHSWAKQSRRLDAARASGTSLFCTVGISPPLRRQSSHTTAQSSSDRRPDFAAFSGTILKRGPQSRPCRSARSSSRRVWPRLYAT